MDLPSKIELLSQIWNSNQKTTEDPRAQKTYLMSANKSKSESLEEDLSNMDLPSKIELLSQIWNSNQKTTEDPRAQKKGEPQTQNLDLRAGTPKQQNASLGGKPTKKNSDLPTSTPEQQNANKSKSASLKEEKDTFSSNLLPDEQRSGFTSEPEDESEQYEDYGKGLIEVGSKTFDALKKAEKDLETLLKEGIF
eukprot:GHVP01030251.1.p1 GENE.GHVP01030251.1~~GHVP01030251.1.p1  ORF type:complete len:222 (-),score=78.44 GHVP01030251.1:57-638(-)